MANDFNSGEYLVSFFRAILSASSQNLLGSLVASLRLPPRLFLAELPFLSVPCPRLLSTLLLNVDNLFFLNFSRSVARNFVGLAAGRCR